MAIYRVSYGQLRGSGIYQRGKICTLNKCVPYNGNNIWNIKYIKNNLQLINSPLIAHKISKSSNKWQLNNITYPNFNSLWVNIPRNSFTILKNNGKA